jgi:4,5-DOPA dioxygenase extradiol
MPALFIGHGAPTVAIQPDDFTRALETYTRNAPRPSAIAVISAHWHVPLPVRVTASESPRLMYDFYDFPRVMYTLTYPSPGTPDLAREIVELLAAAGLPAVGDASRGLDHGVWIPLRIAYGDASIPVVQISLPKTLAPRELLLMGRALRPLRERGVLLIGSGNITHNLRLLHGETQNAAVDAWAAEFDAWVRDRVLERDNEALADYRRGAPFADLAAPTTEHIDPLFVILGAADNTDRVAWIYEGFHHGTLSMRTLAFAPDGEETMEPEAR